MNHSSLILFICEHGAAKSIVASTYFNKLASENRLEFHSVSRGTHPDPEIGQIAIAGLKADGLTHEESTPKKLSPVDIETAQHIISFCELPEEYKTKTPTELWNDVPPISDGYDIARDAIIEHLNRLIKSINNP